MIYLIALVVVSLLVLVVLFLKGEGHGYASKFSYHEKNIKKKDFMPGGGVWYETGPLYKNFLY